MTNIDKSQHEIDQLLNINFGRVNIQPHNGNTQPSVPTAHPTLVHAVVEIPLSDSAAIPTCNISPWATIPHTELVKACIDSPSDHPIWLEFYQRFSSLVKRYVERAWHRCGQPYEIDTLEDLLQDVYLSLVKNDYQALRQFHGSTDQSFLAYLAIICANIVRDYLRKQLIARRNAVAFSLEMELAEAEFSQFDCLITDNTQIELRIYVAQLIKKVQPLWKDGNRSRDLSLFKLHIIAGFTMAELATIKELGLRATSINRIISRIRGRLTHTLIHQERPLG
jgi:RNA polymerase sigma factor (sigma-70 family)